MDWIGRTMLADRGKDDGRGKAVRPTRDRTPRLHFLPFRHHRPTEFFVSARTKSEPEPGLFCCHVLTIYEDVHRHRLGSSAWFTLHTSASPNPRELTSDELAPDNVVRCDTPSVEIVFRSMVRRPVWRRGCRAAFRCQAK